MILDHLQHDKSHCTLINITPSRVYNAIESKSVHCQPDNDAFRKEPSKAYDIKSTLPRVLLSTTEKGQQLGDILGMIDFSRRECNE